MNAERFLCAFLGAVSLAAATEPLELSRRTAGGEVTAVFEPQRKVLQSSSAVIRAKGQELAYGVVVSADGHILTKASEIDGVGELDVLVDRAKHGPARVLGVDERWDVALLKVEAAGLVPVVFAPGGKMERGTWVVANGATSRLSRRALGGIISADAREVSASGGAALGVVLVNESSRLEIADVPKEGGAAEAGLRKGDVIVAVEGIRVRNLPSLAKSIRDRKAGTVVKVTVKRRKESIVFKVRLSPKAEVFDFGKSRNDQMSGDTSRRRSGFPMVIQHDILGNSQSMGGPLLDLEGRCVGMNIARANRAETFAIPVDQLRGVLEGLMAKAGND